MPNLSLLQKKEKIWLSIKYTVHGRVRELADNYRQVIIKLSYNLGMHKVAKHKGKLLDQLYAFLLLATIKKNFPSNNFFVIAIQKVFI